MHTLQRKEAATAQKKLQHRQGDNPPHIADTGGQQTKLEVAPPSLHLLFKLFQVVPNE